MLVGWLVGWFARSFECSFVGWFVGSSVGWLLESTRRLCHSEVLDAVHRAKTGCASSEFRVARSSAFTKIALIVTTTAFATVRTACTMPHALDAAASPQRALAGSPVGTSVLSPRVRLAASASSSKRRGEDVRTDDNGASTGDASWRSKTSSRDRAADIRSNIRNFLKDFEEESEADAQLARAAGANLRRSFSQPSAVSYPGYSVRKKQPTPTRKKASASAHNNGRARSSRSHDDTTSSSTARRQPTGAPRKELLSASQTGLNSSGASPKINFSTIANNIRNGKLKLEEKEQLVKELRDKIADAKKDVELAKATGQRKLEIQKKKHSADTQRLLDMIKALSEDKKSLTEKLVRKHCI